MGASDAINALRSEAVAKTTLVNVISDGIGAINSDAQRVSGLTRQTRSSSQSKLEAENNRVDGYRMSMRTGTRGAGEAAIRFIFQTASAGTGAGAVLNAVAEATKIACDVASVVQDMAMRDRHHTNCIRMACFTSLYAPDVSAAR